MIIYPNHKNLLKPKYARVKGKNKPLTHKLIDMHFCSSLFDIARKYIF